MARTQTLVQLTAELLSALDQRASATGASRSDLIRRAIERFLDEELQDATDRAIVDGYTRFPQELEEDRLAEALARDSIAEEPW